MYSSLPDYEVLGHLTGDTCFGTEPITIISVLGSVYCEFHGTETRKSDTPLKLSIELLEASHTFSSFLLGFPEGIAWITLALEFSASLQSCELDMKPV